MILSVKNRHPNRMSAERKRPRHREKAIVLFIDVLGSQNSLKDGNIYDEYIQNLVAFSETVRQEYPGYIVKAFSDNVIIFRELEDDRDVARESVTGMLSLTAQLQYETLTRFGLLLRGGICIGAMDWTDSSDSGDFVTGRGLIEAYELESKNAVYPRIMADSSIEEYLDADSRGLLVSEGNRYYVDYLKATVTGEIGDSPDIRMLSFHEKAITKHIAKDNETIVLTGREWDEIRSKDAWVLAYHNKFCRRYEGYAMPISFTESLVERNGKDRLEITAGIKESEGDVF